MQMFYAQTGGNNIFAEILV